MTTLQTRAIKNVLESNGKIAPAMIKAGYSVATANQPKVLTESNAWKQVMNQYLPDSKLFKKHEEALDATKFNDFTGDREADHSIRLKAVDMAYKLKGRGVEGSGVSNTQINIVIPDQGFIPQDNVLGYKPTLKRK